MSERVPHPPSASDQRTRDELIRERLDLDRRFNEPEVSLQEKVDILARTAQIDEELKSTSDEINEVPHAVSVQPEGSLVSGVELPEQNSEKTQEEIKHEQRVRAGIVGRAAQLGQAERAGENERRWIFNEEFIEKARETMRKELEEGQEEEQPTAKQLEDVKQEGQTETTQPPSSEAQPVPEAQVEKTTEDFLRELEEARGRYVMVERKHKTAQKSEATGVSISEMDLEVARLEYEKVKGQYARELYLKKIKQLEETGIKRDDARFEEEMGALKAALFEDVILREQDKLARERVNALEQRERTWFRKMIADYAKIPMWKKVLISTGIVTGAVAVGGGIGGLGAVAAFGGYRFVRGMVSGQLAVLTGGLIKTVLTRKAEEYRREEIGKLNELFGTRLGEETIENESALQELIRIRCREYEAVVKEVNRKHRNATRWSMAAGVAVGGVTAYGLAETNLDGPLGNWLSQKFGFVGVRPPEVPLPDVRVPDEVPVPDEALDRLRQAAYEAHVHEARVPEAVPPELIRTPMPDEATITPEVPPAVPSEEEIPVAPAEEVIRPAFENVVKVQAGDSIWRLAERQLEARGYFDNLTGTPEEISAQRIYLIDSIKDKVVENPSAFGVSSGNADLLRVGEEIDFSPAFESNEIQRNTEGGFTRGEDFHRQDIAGALESSEGVVERAREYLGEAPDTGRAEEVLRPDSIHSPNYEPRELHQPEVQETPSPAADYLEKMRSVATIQPPYPVRYWTGQSFEDYFASATKEWGGKALYVPHAEGGPPHVSSPETLERLTGWFKERGDVVSEKFVNYEKVALVIVPQPEDSQFEVMKVISTDERTPWTQSRLIPKDVLYGDRGE